MSPNQPPVRLRFLWLVHPGDLQYADIPDRLHIPPYHALNTKSSIHACKRLPCCLCTARCATCLYRLLTLYLPFWAKLITYCLLTSVWVEASKTMIQMLFMLISALLAEDVGGTITSEEIQQVWHHYKISKSIGIILMLVEPDYWTNLVFAPIQNFFPGVYEPEKKNHHQ